MAVVLPKQARSCREATRKNALLYEALRDYANCVHHTRHKIDERVAIISFMEHVIEPASSGRAKCRACGKPIAKEILRLGERQLNAFGDGEMTLWFHLQCAAYKRSEPLLEALNEEIENAQQLRRDATFTQEHDRLERLAGASRAPTARARCRCCKEMIEKGCWRIGLSYFEDIRFTPSGFIHAGCASDYFGTDKLVARLQHFSPELTEDDIAEISAALS